MRYVNPSFENKIIAHENLNQIMSKLKFKSPLVFTNGCFDILHRGHVTYLAQAKALGATLIVGLNSDDSVRRQNKGIDRPINSLDNRLAVIASLADVDFVTYFSEDTPLNLILEIMPDILVKGGDWPIDKIVGSTEVLNNGGQVYSIPFIYSSSTSQIIAKIRSHDS